jgi:uncharacterized protein (DUF1330 family)
MSKTPKGYWIARVDVGDSDAYSNYVAASGEAFAKFGAHFLARGGRFETMDGASRERNVVIEFPTYDAAIACWHSDEYQRAKSFRDGAAVADVVVVEGYEPTA